MNLIIDRQLDKPYHERANVKDVMRKTGCCAAVAWARLNLFYKGTGTINQVYKCKDN